MAELKCGNCGAPLRQGMAFCTSCGAPAEAVTELLVVDESSQAAPAFAEGGTTPAFCMACGSPLEAGMKFCVNCGTPMGEVADTSGIDVALTPAPVQTAYVQQQAAAMPMQQPPMSQQGVVAPSDVPAETSVKKSKVPLIVGICAAVALLAGGGGFAAAQAGLFGGNASLGQNAASSAQMADASSATASDATGNAAGESAPVANQSTADAASSQPVVVNAESSSAEPAAAESNGQESTNSDPSSDQQNVATSVRVAVPSVAGMSEEEAVKALESAGLAKGEVTREKSDNVEAGKVVGTNPAGGEMAERDASIALVVSDGPKEHRYEFVSQALTWDEARKAAEDKGGYLATITSEEEWNKVVACITGDRTAIVWVGAQKDKDRFAWVTGEDFSFSKWASGEPNNDEGNEDKLTLLKVDGVWSWYDVPNDVSSYYASDRLGYVVEYVD